MDQCPGLMVSLHHMDRWLCLLFGRRAPGCTTRRGQVLLENSVVLQLQVIDWILDFFWTSTTISECITFLLWKAVPDVSETLPSTRSALTSALKDIIPKRWPSGCFFGKCKPSVYCMLLLLCSRFDSHMDIDFGHSLVHWWNHECWSYLWRARLAVP